MVWLKSPQSQLLNPLRRARRIDPKHDGRNNPNVPSQDNGLNAWMDATLNGEELDPDIRFNVNYAKKNSDNNRFKDIDDVPIQGPPKRYNMTHNITLQQATATTNMLVNDSNLRICRKTGMMLPKNTRTPSSTINQWADGILMLNSIMTVRIRFNAMRIKCNFETVILTMKCLIPDMAICENAMTDRVRTDITMTEGIERFSIS